jgi:hypothetical protein
VKSFLSQRGHPVCKKPAGWPTYAAPFRSPSQDRGFHRRHHAALRLRAREVRAKSLVCQIPLHTAELAQPYCGLYELKKRRHDLVFSRQRITISGGAALRFFE